MFVLSLKPGLPPSSVRFPVPAQQHNHQQQQQASSLAGWWGSQPDAVRSLDSPPAAGRKKHEASHASAERAAGKEEKLLLAFSSAGVLGLEQELSLLQNSIDLAEDILRNARSRLDLQGDDILGQVFSSCQVRSFYLLLHILSSLSCCCLRATTAGFLPTDRTASSAEPSRCAFTSHDRRHGSCTSLRQRPPSLRSVASPSDHGR
jgi:hypothetical protein